jgi:hypothetical protein
LLPSQFLWATSYLRGGGYEKLSTITFVLSVVLVFFVLNKFVAVAPTIAMALREKVLGPCCFVAQFTGAMLSLLKTPAVVLAV